MGKRVVKVIAGLIAVCALLIGLLAAALPRLINSDEFRITLRDAAAEALGTPIEWRSLEAGLLPPRLTIRAVAFTAASGNPDDAHLTAESVDLRLALLPIFARRIQVDSLILHGVELVVTRTPEGFLLPIAEEVIDSDTSDTSDETSSDDSAVVDETLGEEAFDLALRRIVISDGRIIIRDRTLPRPIEWRLEDLEFMARGGSAGEPLAIELAANVQSGETAVGRIQLAGTVSLSGLYDLDIEIEKFLLAELQPYISDATVVGTMSGHVSLGGARSTPSEIALDLRVEKLAIRTLGVDLAGELTFRASQALGDPAAFFAIMDLRAGGRAEITGSRTLEGAIDAEMKLDAVDLAWVAQRLPDGASLDGELTGEIELHTTADRKIERLDTKLRIASLRLVSDYVDVSGVFDLVASLEGDGPIQFDAGLELSDGGRLDIEGTSTRKGVLDLHAEIESFDLAVAKRFLPDPEMELAGRATGKARIIGAAASPEFMSLDVSVESGLLRMPDYFVDGPFLATLKLDHPFSDRPSGRIDLDLTTARLEYRDQFKKPPGMRAEMTTKFVSEESGEIVFESRIKFRDIHEILLRGAISDSTSVALTTSSLDLEGWSDVLPALEPYQLDGIVRLRGIGVELIDGSPSQFGGSIDLDGVGLSLSDAGRLRIRGTIVAEGIRIRTTGLRVRMGGMTMGINGTVEDPFDEARFEFNVKSIGAAEVNDLLSSLTSTRDTVFGSLQFSGELRGVASSEADLYSSLEGKLEFSIGKDKGGRLRGVSILRTILDQMPLLGGAARLTQPFRAGRSVDDYFTEHFEIIEGNFEIGQGRVDAKTLRLVYAGYEATLSGPIRLRDLGIDMTGEVLLKADLISWLSGHVGANLAAGKPIRIPLARVTNTLAEPKIVMTKATLAAVPKLFLQATGLDTLAIGVGRALGRVLGGGEK